MEKENGISKPIPDQIIEELLGVIRKQEEFDDYTIDGLEKLWTSGNLKRAEQIIGVIKPQAEE